MFIKRGEIMSKTSERWSLKNLLIYIVLFVVIYLTVILVKFLTGTDINWLSTFLFMFGISAIYLILRNTKKK
uniref:Uncharacterized protein n=1 Tax=Bacillus pumilus TaxID=1408 RepID=A0A385EK60_BACPU|nr:hypothetical protein [Bacillus pumilus]